MDRIDRLEIIVLLSVGRSAVRVVEYTYQEYIHIINWKTIGFLHII